MYLVEQFYKKILKKEPPYYAKYSFLTIVWRPIRKYLNVVIIPNVSFSRLRVSLVRAGNLVNKDVLMNASVVGVPIQIL